MKPQVICVPGSVAPAAARYRPLKSAVGDRADLHLKDLEVYGENTPPAGYSIENELAAIDQLAASLGLDRFNLVAYSGGGFISLAYAGTYPDRLLSLALFEPARIPGQATAQERELYDNINAKLAGLQGPEFMAAFIREQVQPGVTLPPPMPPNPAMANRPAGIAALIRAFETYKFDRGRLRGCNFPIFYAYGSLSHDEQALKAGILGQLCPDIHIQRFDGVHHFVPPEAIYTPRHAQALLALWGAAA